jgi:hypothetical protein
MENELLGFVPGLLNPEQQALAEQRARFSGLTNLGLALLQSGYGQPGQPRQSVGQALVQAAPQALQAYQGGFDQTLRQIMLGQQLAEQQKKRQAEQSQMQAREQVLAGLPVDQRQRLTAFPEMAQNVLFPKPEEAKIVKPGEVLVRGNEILFELPKPDEPIKYDRVDLGNTVAFVDPTTLKTVKVMQKERDPKDTSAGEDTVRKEFFGQAKPYIEISQAYRKIEEATKVPSAAGDVSLIFAFMKILDPGSVVREGEFATAQNAGGIPDRIRAQYNAAVDGQRLAPAQRNDFLNQAKNLARSQQQMFEGQLLPFYSNIAQQRGYDVNKVVDNPFSGLDLSVRQKPTAAGPVKPTDADKSLILKYLTPGQ